MFKIKKTRATKNKKIKVIKDYKLLSGYIMPTKNDIVIEKTTLKNITIYDKEIGHRFVSEKVFRKYNRLITVLTDLLVSDETDEGESPYSEVLNRIEKFRQEIKNKYRYFLTQKELEMMSKQLRVLQKEAQEKELEVMMNYQTNRIR